jgi:hypothetical protein
MGRRAEFRTRYHSTGKEQFSGNPQAFHYPRTSVGSIHHRHKLGIAGHLIPLLTAAAPFVICELIKDGEKRTRAMRGAAVAGAIASEGAWAMQAARQSREQEALQKTARSIEEHCL